MTARRRRGTGGGEVVAVFKLPIPRPVDPSLYSLGEPAMSATPEPGPLADAANDPALKARLNAEARNLAKVQREWLAQPAHGGDFISHRASNFIQDAIRDADAEQRRASIEAATAAWRKQKADERLEVLGYMLAAVRLESAVA